MMNRLLLFWLLRLSLVIGLLPWTLQLNAQCDCSTVNGVVCDGVEFDLTYSGNGIIYVDNDCEAILNIGAGTQAGSVLINAPLGANPDFIITNGYTIGSMVPAGTTVTFKYYLNGNPNTDTLCFDLTFVDTIPPNITTNLLSDTVDCGVANFTQWWQDNVNTLWADSLNIENCGIDTIYHSSPDTLTDNCGTFVDTFYVRDNSGNIAFKTAVYKIEDTTAPVLSGVPPDLTISCSDPDPVAVVTATDDCAAAVTVIFSQDTIPVAVGACANYQFDLRRIWIASDGCGNITADTQFIHVIDNTVPSFDIPADTVVDCGTPTDTMSLGGLSNVLDNCTPFAGLSISMTDNVHPGNCPQQDTIFRTWTVTDACMNSFSDTMVIVVQDTVPPTANFPADITVDCQDAGNLNVTGQPAAVSDNCDPDPAVSNSDAIIPGACEHSYTIERTWKVKDACGDSVTHLQTITVIDTIAPVIGDEAADQTITCDDAVNADSVFNAWVDSHGSATASDNCTDTLIWTAYVAGTNNAAALPAPDCMNPTLGIYRTVDVDFIVMDKCGNADTTSATFTVTDNTAPVITDCPQSDTIETDPGICEANVILPLPMVMEECGNTASIQNFTIAQFLTVTPGVDSVETPVDDVIFNFSVPGPPYTATGSGTLVISLDNVDAEEPTEFFMAYGEDGTVLGAVAHTPFQCGDTMTTFTLSPAQINAWAFDGNIQITLKPNIPANLPGRFSVNPICPGGLAMGELTYGSNFPDHLKFEYSINGSPRILVAPVAPVHEILGQGTNEITYFFTDCAGNQDSCSFEITVEDKEAPVIDCPADFSVNLDPGECEQEVLVPLFSDITDNCAVTVPETQTQATDSIGQLITFSYNPNLNDFVADDKVFTFSGLQGDATPGGVQLVITIQADVDSIGEYFQIFDNDNNLLGTTQSNLAIAGDCNSPSISIFNIPATTFNDWATAGDITITAKSFMSYPIPPAGPGWGINPCNPGAVTNDGDTDGSFIYATFSYESVEPVFAATGATTIGPVTLTPPLEAQTYTLGQGTTNFSYTVTDLAGNVGVCEFDVNVLDTEAPQALCGPTFVDINPSGFVVDTIFPSEIDLGSFDNCSITSMTVTPNTMTCNMEGPNDVVLTVTDASGNVSTCTTFVNVTVEVPLPTASSACGSSTLQLFANPPAAVGGGANTFQYTWFNPAGIPFSFVKDPIILDADAGDLGFYIVVIEGVTGCESAGTVQVTCDLLPLQKPAISTADNSICSTENVQLSTPAVCGSTVKYKWYSGMAPGVLMGTTTVPNFSMLPPASGMFTYYVVVERNGCDSAPSDPISIQVNATPVAMPAQTSITLCEGEQILLNSINNASGTTCHWTGPCGFESFNCSPAPILNSTACNSGIYELVVTKSGCESEPVTVAVNVVAQPATPSVINSTSANNPACNGEQITLTATAVQGAVSYLWTTPMLTTMSSPTNVLVLPNADISKDVGQWTVQVIGNPCESDVSQPTTVFIVPQPEAVTAAVTPSVACEGQDVQLSATSATQGVSYLWTYPDGDTDADPNGTLENVSSGDEGTYTLVVTNQFGCSVTNTVELEVLERVDITGVSSNAPSCVSGPVTVNLVATLFPLDPGNYQYLWTGPGGFASSNTSATIPNATFANSGPYTLVVTNADGCTSLPATVNVAIPEVLPTPNTPVLSGQNPFCEGDAVMLTTSAYQGNAQYVWNTPTGSYTTSTPTLTINSLASVDSGAYTVNYSVGDCPSATSGTIDLLVNAAPLIQPISNSPVCEGETLQLGLNCSAGATYEWTGPGGFSSSVCNPIVPNANPNTNAGTYTVRKRVNGCWSDVVPVNVEVNEKPAVPTAVNAGPFCANTDNVLLTVTSNSATPGAMYTWYNTANEPLGAATPSLNFPLPDPAQYGNGSVEFYVVASIDGCESAPSVPMVVNLNTVPSNLAEAGPDILACEGDIIVLEATVPTVGTGLWTLVDGNPNGVSIANPDDATTTVSGLVPGENYVFQWSLSNGACENYSTDETAVFINFIEEADAGEPFVACFTSTVNLAAVQPLSNIGTWSQPASQASLGVGIVDPADPATQVTGLVPGNTYSFTWTIDGGCGMSSDGVLVTVSNESAYAGADFQQCGPDPDEEEICVSLTATAPSSGVGMWTSPTGIVFDDPVNAQSTACNIRPGINIMIWTTNDGACGHHSVDSVVVDYSVLVVRPDVVSVPFGESVTTNVVANDIITGQYELNIIQEPFHGDLELGPGGQMTFEADLNYIGDDVVIYQICQEDCDCVDATITFKIGENAGCEVPSIITPNNDGINDAFVIPCIANGDRFPASVVSIFNQWGDEVFHAGPYQNDWMGTFDGEELPSGTYFYVVDLGDGNKPMSGYLIIQR